MAAFEDVTLHGLVEVYRVSEVQPACLIALKMAQQGYTALQPEDSHLQLFCGMIFTAHLSI
jgi:hypothetical protein